ncbi:hypothetical protein [Salinicola halophilus]|uniref:hypothetical protein n=1 Tax=Salinicola halophilus TaxID=184065 RepID=UPI0013A6326A|nr:hypothetical protein [Salinicola halophilus]
MPMTLVEAFEPWFKADSWHTHSPEDDRRFHRCCYDFLQIRGRQVTTEDFVDRLRDAIQRQNDGEWSERDEEALTFYTLRFDAIVAYLGDTEQLPGS